MVRKKVMSQKTIESKQKTNFQFVLVNSSLVSFRVKKLIALKKILSHFYTYFAIEFEPQAFYLFKEAFCSLFFIFSLFCLSSFISCLFIFISNLTLGTSTVLFPYFLSFFFFLFSTSLLCTFWNPLTQKIFSLNLNSTIP